MAPRSTGLTVDAARDRIRGPKGSIVKLGLERKGAPLELSITRDVVQEQEVESKALAGGNVGYLRVAGFSDAAADEVVQALKDHLAAGRTKFILDLRGNPGGYVTAARKIASQFIGSGVLFCDPVPSVSVILPTRNRPDYLLEALQSVARQSHSEIELVLVRDGGSPLGEKAREILEELEFPYLLVERDDPPEGLAQARDNGIARARGDAFAFLDDDDLWEPGHVKQLADALDRDRGSFRGLFRLEDRGGVGYGGAAPRDRLRPRRLRPKQLHPSERLRRHPGGLRAIWTVRPQDGLLRGLGLASSSRAQRREDRAGARGVGDDSHPLGGLSALVPERLAERQRSLDELSRRHRVGPITPKTFWEVAGDLCTDGSASKH